jgi:hypothetical protein
MGRAVVGDVSAERSRDDGEWHVGRPGMGERRRRKLGGGIIDARRAASENDRDTVLAAHDDESAAASIVVDALRDLPNEWYQRCDDDAPAQTGGVRCVDASARNDDGNQLSGVHAALSPSGACGTCAEAREMLRVFLAFVTVFFSCAPLAAGAAPQIFTPPVVVVYPFTVSGSAMSPQVGGDVALLIANRLDAIGGLNVKPFTPGTERPDYLIAAEKQNADYYVTGFLTPIGAEVSLIVQVVSTYGGTVEWSTTSTIRTYNDAVAQADGIHDAILSHAERSLASLGAPPPPSTPEPTGKDAAGLSLTRILGRKHHAVTGPEPSPSPNIVAAVPKPEAAVPGALVANVGGSAQADVRSFAASALAEALRKDGVARAGGIPVDSSDAIARAADLCKANGSAAETLYTSSLAVDAQENDISLDVSAYDCSGKRLATQHVSTPVGRHESVHDAVTRAASQAVATLVKSLPKAR